MKTSVIFGLLVFVKLKYCFRIAWREIGIGGEKCTKTDGNVRGTMNAVADFEESLNCTTYVDKTMMIAEYFEKGGFRHRQYSVITCPHKFGKSTNLDMMRRFVQGDVKFVDYYKRFETEKKLDEMSHKIFHKSNRKLKITPFLKDTEEFYKDNYQQYSTMYVSFKVTGVKSYDELIKALWKNWVVCFKQYKRLFDKLENRFSSIWDKSDEHERLQDERDLLRESLWGWKYRSDEADVESGLFKVSKVINRFYPYSKIFIFIDDYDDPIIQAIEHNFDVKRVAYLMDKIFSTLFKGDKRFIHHAMITGTLNVIDMNKFSFFKHWNFLDNHHFVKYFGLTEDEVDELFGRYGINIKDKEIVKRYYDGYNTSHSPMRIYNPYSIASYLCHKSANNSFIALDTYWTKTCPIPSFWKFFQKHNLYQELLNNLLTLKKVRLSLVDRWSLEYLQELQTLVHGNINRFTNHHADLILSYLFHHGYLSHTEVKNLYCMPNNEDIKSCLKLSTNDSFRVLDKISLKAKLSPTS